VTKICPRCGSRNLRYSRLRSPAERLTSLLGVRPIRCRDCHVRFVDRTFHVINLRYARCPKCFRTDLSTWSRNHYKLSVYKRLLLSLGAKPYRCDGCRYNFVSFRPRKKKSRSTARKEQETESAASRPAEPNGDSSASGQTSG
jgi:predicted Zn-ribbon and HTH transcriptional regulator